MSIGKRKRKAKMARRKMLKQFQAALWDIGREMLMCTRARYLEATDGPIPPESIYHPYRMPRLSQPIPGTGIFQNDKRST